VGTIPKREDKVFKGTCQHTIDAKGRMIIPLKFREELGDNFIITNGLGKCLCAYPLKTFEIIADKCKKISTTDREGQQFIRFFIGSADECEIDATGRVLVPANLRKSAGLTKDIDIVGMGDKLEIWNHSILEDEKLDEKIRSGEYDEYLRMMDI
jgi:MraZ protein